MTRLFFILLLDVIKILLIFFIYKDVANYLPIPQLNMAQFFGVAILLECIVVYFLRNYADLEAFRALSKDEQMAHFISKASAIVLMFLLYQVVKLFL